MIPTFHDLGLSTTLQETLVAAGYIEPTEIQQKVIPAILMGRDILASAKTGSGKTASYALPMLDMLDQRRKRARMPRAIVLSPTRELALQVVENFTKYGDQMSLEMLLLIGGVNMAEQDRVLNRGVDVLVATPGRLLDHVGRGRILLSGVETLVIDEVDRMLDIGFIDDIERLVKMLPPKRQTLMLSATMPKEMERLSKKFLNDPKRVIADPPSKVSTTIQHSLLHLGNVRVKHQALIKLLSHDTVNGGIIFCNRKREVSVLRCKLKSEGFSVDMLHGDMDQHHRLECLARFRAKEVAFLVCSDVAARGLDIPMVDHVFNLDVPIHAEDYVHRVGRTGRAGRAGCAVTLATDGDERLLAAIEEMIGEKIAPLNAALCDTGEMTLEAKPACPGKSSSESVLKASADKRSPRGARRAKAKSVRVQPPCEEVAEDAVASFSKSAHVPRFLRF
ncbi:MAG: DEAD/DEAH box helicase [Alphaproteobacteria bacterium]|nr:DEAD/DEAH box helicase [Alphaproteobacteria bacterium]